MKKIFIIGISLLLIIGLSSIIIVKAQDNKEVKKETVQNRERGRNFVDNDKDGICDNNKSGFGRGMGRTGMNRSRNYVDNDKDGICDNFSQGKGKLGNNAGPNFVDKNNDGVCDNRPEGMRKGNGHGRKIGNCDGTHKGWRGRR
ncbi:MAG: hypothetical protein HZB41_13410 [Ignavibacteriae bacterium]|nr:hypothetical protein [Ignavibacteriota bacterium]